MEQRQIWISDGLNVMSESPFVGVAPRHDASALTIRNIREPRPKKTRCAIWDESGSGWDESGAPGTKRAHAGTNQRRVSDESATRHPLAGARGFLCATPPGSPERKRGDPRSQTTWLANTATRHPTLAPKVFCAPLHQEAPSGSEGSHGRIPHGSRTQQRVIPSLALGAFCVRALRPTRRIPVATRPRPTPARSCRTGCGRRGRCPRGPPAANTSAARAQALETPPARGCRTSAIRSRPRRRPCAAHA